MGLTSKIRALIAYANETTAAGDTTLGDAVKTLCDGYGQGGGGAMGGYANEQYFGDFNTPLNTGLTLMADATKAWKVSLDLVAHSAFNYAVIASCMLEREPYPGVYLRFSGTDRAQFNGGTSGTPFQMEHPYHMEIIWDGTGKFVWIWWDKETGRLFETWMTYVSITNHTSPLSIGCGIDGNGNIFRALDADFSNVNVGWND